MNQYTTCVGCGRRQGWISLITPKGELKLCRMCHAQMSVDIQFPNSNRHQRRRMAKLKRAGKL